MHQRSNSSAQREAGRWLNSPVSPLPILLPSEVCLREGVKNVEHFNLNVVFLLLGIFRSPPTSRSLLGAETKFTRPRAPGLF